MNSFLAKNKKGFTLTEVLLAIAIFSALMVMSVPVYHSFQTRNELDITENNIVNSLRQAQNFSQSGQNDSSWGVQINNDQITVFSGNSFAARDTGLDESFEISGAITTSGLNEVVFTKTTGLPQSTGTITLDSTINESSDITINEKGMIQF